MNLSLRERLRSSGIHLLVSLCIAALSALLVFGLWYPYPYREISDGTELFLLVVTVDIVLGPLITFVVFSRRKLRAVLWHDLVVVGVIQLAALGYGLWTVFVVRPVHLVFEIDRFRVVHAIEVDTDLLSRAPAEFQVLPFVGPSLLAVRPFKDEQEEMNVTMAALQGVSLASQPNLWRPFAEARAEVLKAARPAEQLLARFSSQSPAIHMVLKDVGRSPQNTVYLPLVGRKSFWTVFLDPVTAEVVATMPLDSF